MKIAIVEWWPRVCGATDWGVHLSSGGAKLGHQVDRLTFSKSGKALEAWQPKRDEWKVAKQSDATEVLNGYDLVIQTDIACRARSVDINVPDGSLPYYVKVLQDMKPRWTTMIHDGAYNKRLNPVIQANLATPSFAGTLITARYPEAAPRIMPLTGRNVSWIVDPFIPYDVNKLSHAWSKNQVTDRRRSIIFLSRLSSNKGQNAVLDLMQDLNCDLDLWGTDSFGHPSLSWLLWEQAARLGYKQCEFRIRSDKAGLKSPDARKYWGGPFSLITQKGWVIRYHGSFGAVTDVDWSPWISLSLTNTSLTGVVEYAALDAIAAGCVTVVPEHQLKYGSWPYLVGVPYERFNEKKAEWNRPMIVRMLNELLSVTDKILTEYANNQQAWLRKHHDPARILGKIVKNL